MEFQFAKRHENYQGDLLAKMSIYHNPNQFAISISNSQLELKVAIRKENSVPNFCHTYFLQ
jgi:hypothetical protein